MPGDVGGNSGKREEGGDGMHCWEGCYYFFYGVLAATIEKDWDNQETTRKAIGAELSFIEIYAEGEGQTSGINWERDTMQFYMDASAGTSTTAPSLDSPPRPVSTTCSAGF